MEPQGADRSPSPSGSEEMESNADSDHEDEGENEKDSDNENQADDDDDDEDEDKDDSDGDDSEMETGDNGDHCEDSESQSSKNVDSPLKQIGKSREHLQDGESNSDSESRVRKKHNAKSRDEGHTQDGESYSADSEYYPMADLPLEVITVVEPTNYAYPVLKNMSNGVLTHRNIFTEHERSVLKEIINKYRNIVDTRSRTREIYLEKQSVWQQIVEEYNSTENIMVRTEKELRKCWDNMKYRAKQAEKEMIKVEQSFAGMEHDLQNLAQQAFEEAAMQAKVLQKGGIAKTEGLTPEFEVKMEPLDNEEGQSASADEDDYEVDGASNPGGGLSSGLPEEEREPALKKARQESPKLSSLLLAAANKRSPSKKSGGHKSSSGGSFPYNIPACTKVMHIKKKNHSSVSALNASSNSEIPILPKGLASCLSITNIPNPISSNSHSGLSFGTHGKELGSPGSSPIQHSMKPMPSLKKMVPGKHQSSGSGKSSMKKSNSLSSKNRGHSSNSSQNVNSGHNLNLNHSSVVQGNSGLGSPTNSVENYASELTDRLLNTKLATQRLELERREHEIRMKLLEKELQAQTYQSQYWFLKLKMLKSGRENASFNMAGATNGDID
ncbi:uncharacterized protein [Penaeus vannamei]|uniref:uncharacterized protein isoform X1 n=1 Tax=Penaeus vannamei TaxID=6689 RepID=UPI000F65B952|nr:dentin matrix acidic phosphoprotein 1-like isoform X1 [Penaeus vannamei]